MRAADFVGFNLQQRHGIGFRLRAQEQVSVRLVSVRALSVFVHFDQAAIDGRSPVHQHDLEEQIAFALWRHMLLESMVVKLLDASADAHAQHVGARPRLNQLAVAVNAPEFAAKGCQDPTHVGILTDVGSDEVKVINLFAPFLQTDEVNSGTGLGENLNGSAAEGGKLALR